VVAGVRGSRNTIEGFKDDLLLKGALFFGDQREKEGGGRTLNAQNPKGVDTNVMGGGKNPWRFIRARDRTCSRKNSRTSPQGGRREASSKIVTQKKKRNESTNIERNGKGKTDNASNSTSRKVRKSKGGTSSSAFVKKRLCHREKGTKGLDKRNSLNET